MENELRQKIHQLEGRMKDENEVMLRSQSAVTNLNDELKYNLVGIEMQMEHKVENMTKKIQVVADEFDQKYGRLQAGLGKEINNLFERTDSMRKGISTSLNEVRNKTVKGRNSLDISFSSYKNFLRL